MQRSPLFLLHSFSLLPSSRKGRMQDLAKLIILGANVLFETEELFIVDGGGYGGHGGGGFDWGGCTVEKMEVVRWA